ncbi:hypothetical protein [Haloferax sp. DFSO52]|uniref:hypothetical protein n=1 Tax=Haloferax sp. DFSO52 TaxID=3388505 RepID=UPI003A89DC15
MNDPSSSDGDWPLNRRSALKLTGGFLLASALGGQAGAIHGQDDSQRVYRVKQGSREFEIDLLVGDKPVRELYDLRIPSYYGGDNGATDPGEGPYYESVGLTYLLEGSSTVMFLYHGPDGISLVAVHGGGNSEGNVTWRVTGVPNTAKWLVKDDLYTYSDTGELARSNNDKWNVSGSVHVVDWTWRNSQSDGGVIGYLDGDFALTIDPAYNEAATLYGEYYEGNVTSWQVLTGTWSNLTRQSLNLTDPVTITCETLGGPEEPTSPEPTEEPAEEETPEPTEEEPAEPVDEEKDKPEWKEDRDEAREEWKEDRDEWQEKRDEGDDDWKEDRDEAREERKKKRDEWQEKRDKSKDKAKKKSKDDDDDEDDDDDKEERKKKSKDKDKRKNKRRGKRDDDDDDDDRDDDDDDDDRDDDDDDDDRDDDDDDRDDDD